MARVNKKDMYPFSKTLLISVEDFNENENYDIHFHSLIYSNKISLE